MNDHRFTLRQLLRNPGFTAVAFLTLTLGSGADMVVAHPSSGIVVDKSGAVIFADERRNIVFRIDVDGKLTQWITRKHCHELFLDGEGNLYGEHLEYLSDTTSWRSSIWKRDAAGRVTDVYGPAAGFAPGLLMDGQGNRYQSNGNESPNGPVSVITKRSPEGRVTVLAGGTRGERDGKGDAAQLGAVLGMAWGPERNLYFTEADAVRRATMEGVVTTLARGFRGPKDPDLPARRLWGLTVDSTGAAFVADHGNRRVIKVTGDGKVSTVLRAEKPWSPAGVALKGDTLFVLEHGFVPLATNLGPRVRKLLPDGTAVVLATVTDQAVKDARQALLEVGNHNLNARLLGQGTPAVVLSAGLGDDSTVWAKVQELVSKRVRTFAYDRAGTGKSERGPLPRTMRQAVLELHTALKAAKVEPPCILVGHSCGGLIVRFYTEQYPGDVAGLVLVDPTHESVRLHVRKRGETRGRWVRIRENAKDRSIPAAHTTKQESSTPPWDDT